MRIDDNDAPEIPYTIKQYWISCNSPTEHMTFTELLINGHPYSGNSSQNNCFYFSVVLNGSSIHNGTRLQCRGRLGNVDELCSSNSITLIKKCKLTSL